MRKRVKQSDIDEKGCACKDLACMIRIVNKNSDRPVDEVAHFDLERYWTALLRKNYGESFVKKSDAFGVSNPYYRYRPIYSLDSKYPLDSKALERMSASLNDRLHEIRGELAEAIEAEAVKIASRETRTVTQSRQLLALGSAILPKKLSSEVLGDEWEQIELREQKGMHPWLNQLHTVSAVAWAFMYTLKEFAAPSAVFAAIWRLLG